MIDYYSCLWVTVQVPAEIPYRTELSSSFHLPSRPQYFLSHFSASSSESSKRFCSFSCTRSLGIFSSRLSQIKALIPFSIPCSIPSIIPVSYTHLIHLFGGRHSSAGFYHQGIGCCCDAFLVNGNAHVMLRLSLIHI